MNAKVGLFGGTFDPIHHGHIFIADETKRRLNLDKIIFLPSGISPHKNTEKAEHRYNMIKMAIADYPYFEVSETEIQMGVTNYTIDTLKLLEIIAPAPFRFIIGLDAFLDIVEWGQTEELMKLANFIVVRRFGASFGDLTKLNYMHPDFNRGLVRLDNDFSSHVDFKLKNKALITLLPVPLYLLSSTDVRRKIKK